MKFAQAILLQNVKSKHGGGAKTFFSFHFDGDKQ
jgi:hypothetical protein